MSQEECSTAGRGGPRATRPLRRAVYASKLPMDNRGTLDSRFDTHIDDDMPETMVGVRQRQTAVSLWLLDPRGCYVNNEVLQTALRESLGLPLHPPQQPCASIQALA